VAIKQGEALGFA